MLIKSTHIVYDFHSDAAGYLNALETGSVIEITPATFDYFLEVLPPVYMNRSLLIDGIARQVMFGFAEGREPVTAFWSEDCSGITHYYCTRTVEMNRAS